MLSQSTAQDKCMSNCPKTKNMIYLYIIPLLHALAALVSRFHCFIIAAAAAVTLG
jgi:hypothetical protein